MSNDLEKRARDLLAAEYERDGEHTRALWVRSSASLRELHIGPAIRAIVTVLEVRQELPKEEPVVCDGCGATMSDAALAEFKRLRPYVLSCCPDRKPIPATEWRKRAQAAEARVSELEAVMRPLAAYADWIDQHHAEWAHDGFAVAGFEDVWRYSDFARARAIMSALEPRPAAPEEREAQETIRDGLMDSQYLAGVKAGWNASQASDPEAAYAVLVKSREGHLAGYAEAKAVLALRPTVSDGWEEGFKAGRDAAADFVLGALACSICLEIDGCRCDYTKSVSRGPCRPPTDKLVTAIRALAPPVRPSEGRG